MTHVIPCPECASRIRIGDEMIGKRVRCPRCDQFFTANPNEGASPVTTLADPVPEASNPRTLPRDMPRPQRHARIESPGMRESETWENVLTGINLQLLGHRIGIAGGLIAIGSFILLATSADSSRSTYPVFFDRLMGAGICVAAILVAGNWIAALAGNAFALAAPLSRGSRSTAVVGLALVALVLIGMAENYRIVTQHVPFGNRIQLPDEMGPSGENYRLAAGLTALLSMASLPSLLDATRMILVPLFVRSVGQNLRDRETADKAQFQMWCIAIVFIAALGMELLFHLANRGEKGHKNNDPFFFFALAFALAAARLMMLVFSLFALTRAKASLVSHLRAAVRAEIP